MYYFFSLLTGVLVAIMIVFNGDLAAHYGLHTSTIIIHVAGLAVLLAVLLIKRIKIKLVKIPWYFYIGGAIGIFTVVFTNYAFAHITVSEIMALGLLGQGIAGLLIDQTGWLGLPKHPFKARKIVGLLLILAGIAYMTSNFVIMAILAAFATGFTVIFARSLNAKLAEFSSVPTSAFFNYVVGLICSIPILLILGRGELDFSNITFSPNILIYLGGPVGLCTVLISNVIVTKVPAFYLSLLMFVGQVFTGILLDALISGSFSMQLLIGGALVAAGLSVDLMLDKRAAKIDD
ncbi:MAG: DMT family transporter [Lachnospiraceae bacterium]|nr:DMT family transporter [Lachnospiraceae bacterium]